MNDLKFDFNDIALTPIILSDIRSRSEINIKDKNNKIRVAPKIPVANDCSVFFEFISNTKVPYKANKAPSKCIRVFATSSPSVYFFKFVIIYSLFPTSGIIALNKNEGSW